MIKETKIDWELADKIHAREEDKILENMTKKMQDIAQDCSKRGVAHSSISRSRMHRAHTEMLAQLSEAFIDANWEVLSKSKNNIIDSDIDRIITRLNNTLSKHIRSFMQSIKASAQRNRSWGSAVSRNYEEENNRTKGKLLAKAKRKLEIRRGLLELEAKENVSPPLSERIKQYFHLQDSIKNEYREITFVDIDIAGSTSLKEGESKKAVVYSFGQYNQMLDNLTPDLVFRLLPESPVWVTESDGCLLIVNNESGFSEEDVELLCSVGETKKTKREGYIGEKGIGFKSVFQVTMAPHIFSNGYQFYFKENDPEIGLGYIVPYWVDEIPPELKQDTDKTQILLPLKPGKRNEISLRMAEIAPETILFLRKLVRTNNI